MTIYVEKKVNYGKIVQTLHQLKSVLLNGDGDGCGLISTVNNIGNIGFVKR
jgi:hypothetical protein